MSNSKSAFHTNGSSVHSSGSTTPEPVADLPPAHLFEHADERVPTPFPLAQQPIDETIGNPQQYPLSLSSSWVCPPPPLPLAMPIPSSRSRSPVQHGVINMQPSNNESSSISIPRSPIHHAVVNMQPSNSDSSSISITRGDHYVVVNIRPSTSGSSSISNPPVPLTPTVLITNYPYSLSSSVSQLSAVAYGDMRQRLHLDRQMNEATPSRSVASGLYQFASMVVPFLPEYETSSEDDLGVLAQRRRKDRQENTGLAILWICAAAVVGGIYFGKRMGYTFLDVKKW